MKIAWSLLARAITRSANDAGLHIRDLIIDGVRSKVGFPFKPQSLSVGVRLDTEVGEDAEGAHELTLLISDDDGAIIAELRYPFILPVGQRTYVMLIPLGSDSSIVFPRMGYYKFHFILDGGVDASDFVIAVL